MNPIGYSSSGRRYREISEVWRRDAKYPTGCNDGEDDASFGDWYGKSRDHWETTELSDNGVLGGYGHVSLIDLDASRSLISSLPVIELANCLDCGAGIGRITEGLLLPLFSRVDLVEQSPSHVDAARARLGSRPNMGELFVEGLQTFIPRLNFYNLIWIQWVVGYLTDPDLERFLNRCADGLRGPNSFVIMKENIARKEFFLDSEDNCLIRTQTQFQALFRRTRLILVKTKVQQKFPSELRPVYMFVLKRRP